MKVQDVRSKSSLPASGSDHSQLLGVSVRATTVPAVEGGGESGQEKEETLNDRSDSRKASKMLGPREQESMQALIEKQREAIHQMQQQEKRFQEDIARGLLTDATNTGQRAQSHQRGLKDEREFKTPQLHKFDTSHTKISDQSVEARKSFNFRSEGTLSESRVSSHLSTSPWHSSTAVHRSLHERSGRESSVTRPQSDGDLRTELVDDFQPLRIDQVMSQLMLGVCACVSVCIQSLSKRSLGILGILIPV